MGTKLVNGIPWVAMAHRHPAYVTRGEGWFIERRMAHILPPSLAALAAGLSPQGAATGPETGRAAQGPMPAPVSAAANPLPPPSPPAYVDSPAEARGRRVLSTAFVRVGPDGQLTVALRDGRRLTLRDVAMGRETYCGRYVSSDRAGKRFCGGYADVVAAGPGDVPPAAADPAQSRPAPRTP